MLLMSMTFGLTSCFDTVDDNPIIPDNPVIPDNPTDLSEYAILYYAYGGGSLDIGLVPNMADFFKGKAESYNQVKIAVQYKFSSEDDLKSYWIDDLLISNSITQETADREWAKLKPMGQQTIRFIVDPTVGKPADDVIVNEKYIYGQKNCDIASVDSLTNFINWATKACPAKHYVLVLADHGGGYMPHDDTTFAAQTRGLLYDIVSPNGPTHRFTASSLKYALEHVNARMDVIYLDACLMNTVEYQFELKDVADYLILSTFSVPGIGGSYSLLIDELATSDLETALSNYNKGTVEKWDQMAAEYFAAGYTEYEWDYHDMTVTRTRNLDAFGEKFRVFVDKLVAAYADEGNKAKIDTITKYTFKVDSERPSYDLVDYAESITLALPDVFDVAFSNELASAFNSCLVSQYCSDFLMKKGWSVDCSIMLAVKGNYYVYYSNNVDPSKIESYILFYADGRREDYEYGNPEPINSIKWGSTLADTYEKLAFDKATGWSRWLYLNEQIPCENSPTQINSLFDDYGYIKVR